MRKYTGMKRSKVEFDCPRDNDQCNIGAFLFYSAQLLRQSAGYVFTANDDCKDNDYFEISFFQKSLKLIWNILHCTKKV